MLVVETRMAVRPSPSMSPSLPNTPGAVTFNVVFSLVLYESFTARGASFTAVTVMVTVATFESELPSLAL